MGKIITAYAILNEKSDEVIPQRGRATAAQ
jgi:hypothetical protein